MKLIITLVLTFLFSLTNTFGQGALPNKLLWEEIRMSNVVNVAGKTTIGIKKNTAFVFLSPECPLCKNYMLISYLLFTSSPSRLASTTNRYNARKITKIIAYTDYVFPSTSLIRSSGHH